MLPPHLLVKDGLFQAFLDKFNKDATPEEEDEPRTKVEFKTDGTWAITAPVNAAEQSAKKRKRNSSSPLPVGGGGGDGAGGGGGEEQGAEKRQKATAPAPDIEIIEID
jgi:hypothetical protein